MPVHLVDLQKRPDLAGPADALVASVWPIFVLKDPVAGRYWHQLCSMPLAAFQTVAVETIDTVEHVVGFANAIPFAWDGLETSLPDGGWDAVLRNGMECLLKGGRANTLSALSITVHPDKRGTGLAERLIEAMKASAVAAGLNAMVAPVRPTRKAHYPLQPFEEYCSWRRPDGLPFDPWIRTHQRLGAHIVKIAPRSMVIEAPVEAWESWTGMTFPATGRYWVSGALAPIEIDLDTGKGLYVEPNLWMHYSL